MSAVRPMLHHCRRFPLLAAFLVATVGASLAGAQVDSSLAATASESSAAVPTDGAGPVAEPPAAALPLSAIAGPAGVTGFSAVDTPSDGGNSVTLVWTEPEQISPGTKYRIERRAAAAGDWSLVTELSAGANRTVDEPIAKTGPELRNGTEYEYRLTVIGAAGEVVGEIATVVPQASLINWRRLAVLGFLVLFFGLILLFIAQSRRGREVYIRPIAGLKALEEAVGRATEMGKPVFFMPGIDEANNIQTLYGMVILQHVTRLVARYETPLIVAVGKAFVVPLAEETMRQGYLDAGRPELYHPSAVRYFSDEQFATVTAVAGIFLREKPATNLYFGSFYAESLILAETGFMSGSIQIAGTGNIHQLPFFVVACDYTLIGEEFFAVSAYLSKDPKLLGSLKAMDLAKAGVLVTLLIGCVIASLSPDVGQKLAAVFSESPPWVTLP